MGSNPTVVLIPIVLLTIFRFAGQQIKEAVMEKKLRNSKSKVCKAKRRKVKVAAIINHIFETTWAVGASVTAAMAISTSIHQRAPKGALFCVGASVSA